MAQFPMQLHEIALEMVISYSLYKTLSLNGEFEY